MKKWFVIHPVLFALFPILFLFAHNMKEMSLGETLRPTVLVLSFTLLLWLVLALLSKNLRKAAIITSIFLMLFFSYGHILDFLPHMFRYMAYLHFFLFALIPIPTILSPAISTMSFLEILQSITVVGCLGLLLWLLLNFFIKKRKRAALITIMFLLSFLGYGYLANYVLDVLFYLPVSESYFFPFWVMLFSGSTFLVIKTRRKLDNLTNFLNFVAIFLMVVPITTAVFYEVFLQDSTNSEGELSRVNLARLENYPNIYYIILDGYGRADILKEYYQYDNGEFLKYLRQKGFCVLDIARSNYAQTALSLASSLNLTYLGDLAKQMGVRSRDRRPLLNRIRNNEVAKFLRQQGYLLAAFSTGVYDRTIKGDADIYMVARKTLSEFENLFLNTTPIPRLLDRLPERSPYDFHRERLLYVFEHLADMAELDTPVFVFAHILAPHPPFVFGENGEKVKPNLKFSFDDAADAMGQKEYVMKYRSQLIFVNKKMKTVIDEIISKSSRPAIIILQADHGPGLHRPRVDKHTFKERMSIFNAFSLPGGGREKLYPEITPVNTFRVIFNHYFGAELQLLEDKCYYSTWENPYELIDVTEKQKSN
jgi:hypothetical protein